MAADLPLSVVNVSVGKISLAILSFDLIPGRVINVGHVLRSKCDYISLSEAKIRNPRVGIKKSGIDVPDTADNDDPHAMNAAIFFRANVEQQLNCSKKHSWVELQPAGGIGQRVQLT